MNLRELPEALNLEVLQDTYEDRPLTGGYTSDLLSDVMANAHERDVLITIQSHKNTVAVATLVGVGAIILCNNRPVPEEMVQAARDEEIGIFRSAENQFIISGKVYDILHGSS
jgi:serine kinase of HPr protein (carbohydrate metabolism regulator)